MKKILLALTAAFTFTAASAQLPNGSVCPDFTGTDLNGNTWNLYDLLDQGYAVVVDVSAAWCGPCWNYHNSGALETLYEEHGPDGDNTVRVLFIEGESQNTGAQLTGTSGAGALMSQGDWVAGTPYPIIDDASIADLLQIGYFPTVYTICPNRIVTETGQISAAEHVNFITTYDCQPASLSNEPSIVNAAIDAACDGATVNVLLQNQGTANLTSATITITGGAQTVVENWTGNLATYGTANVAIEVPVNGNSNLNVTITSPDDYTGNNTRSAAFTAPATATTHIRMDILFDNWPEEMSWVILDENGNEAAVSEDYSNETDASNIFVDVYLPSNGCYKFIYTDEFGDGLLGSQWGATDGHFIVYGMGTDGVTPMAPIYAYDGSYNLESEERNVDVTLTSSVDELSMNSALVAYPNPANDVLNLSYSLTKDAVVTVEMVDMLGNIVLSQQVGSKQAGLNNTQLDVNQLAAGMYVVNLKANNGVTSMRVSVSK